jgi:hypothetical protein
MTKTIMPDFFCACNLFFSLPYTFNKNVQKYLSMKQKVKIPMQTIVRYIRDFSIVVAGIAVTLYTSDRVTGKSEKRDLSRYMNAVKLEMEENINTLEDVIERLQPSIRYTQYLNTHDRKSLDKDTLQYYAMTCCYSFYSPTFKTNAFEMFKSSGMMRLITDKELLLLLWDVYDVLGSIKDEFDVMFPIKWEDIKRETTLIMEGKEVEVPMYNFYRMGLPYDMLRPCERALEKSREVVVMFESAVYGISFDVSEFKTPQITDEELDKYLGVYVSEQTPLKMTITKINGKLFGRGSGQSSFPLETTEKNKFKYRQEGIVIEFNPTEKTMILKQYGRTFNFVKED